jgi:NADP-dependent aldehyde dehydrogenase
MYKDATIEEINKVMEDSWQAFHKYRKMPLKAHANFMRTIGLELQSNSASLVQSAMKETNLPEARLKGELARTVFQLNQYGSACEKGEWLEVRIDTALPEKNPPKQDIGRCWSPWDP